VTTQLQLINIIIIIIFIFFYFLFFFIFFSVVPPPALPPTEPCALRSTQPLKVSARDFSWGKGDRCVWLTIYDPCNAERSRKSGALTYPEPLGPPRPVAGKLYFTLF